MSNSPLLKFALRARNFILGLIYLLPVFSLAVVFLIYDKDRDSEYLSFPVKKHLYLWLGIEISAAISLLLILYGGIENMLFFIPSSWMIYDEISENSSGLKPYLVLCFAVGFWIFIFNLLHRDKEKTRKIKELSSRNSVQEVNNQ